MLVDVGGLIGGLVVLCVAVGAGIVGAEDVGAGVGDDLAAGPKKWTARPITASTTTTTTAIMAIIGPRLRGGVGAEPGGYPPAP